MSWLDDVHAGLLALGLPGLAALAFFDSGIAGIPAGPDTFVMVLAHEEPVRGWLVVLAVTLGSVAGSFFRYSWARKVGELALRRFDPGWQDWAHEAIRSHGVWTVFLSCIAPPPFPLALVVMAAGVFRMRRPVFVATALAGRGLRYAVVAWLGIRYGEQAGAVLREQLPLLLGVVAVLALAGGFAARHLWRRRAREETG